jgi:hypothetical protein
MRVTVASVLAVIGTAVLCGSLVACGQRATLATSSTVAPAGAVVAAARDEPTLNLANGFAHSGSAVEVAIALKATGGSNHKWWAAEIVLAQAAATWILAAIFLRGPFTTRRRRRHSDLNRRPDITFARAGRMTTSAAEETREPLEAEA